VWEGNGQALVGTTAANTFNLANLTAVSGLAYVDGSSGNDFITGSAFADDLRGGVGTDFVGGGGGDDNIRGGTGRDTLIGGEGADRFLFSEAGTTNRDTLLDYSFADNDVIDVSALLDAAFGDSSNVADFARLTVLGEDLVLQVDVNGATGGAVWSDVAYLTGASAAGQALVHFEQQAHTLSVA
jgi:Ca2+-binding RTX toxin-like protein